MPELIQNYDQITSEWLSEAAGMPVTVSNVEEIGKGLGVIGAVYRCSLEGPSVESGDAPSSLVVKLTGLDENAAMTGTVLRMYEREAKFFDALSGQAPIRVPKGYYANVSEDGSVLNLVMEDFGSLRAADQVAGISVADAEVAVDALAKWHAQWWNKVDGVAESGAAVHLHDPIYPALLPMLFAEGWEKLMATEACVPDETVQQLGPRWGEAAEGMLQTLGSGNVTLLHGDFRADNLLFADDGSLALLDFQLTGVGSPAYDLAYFVTQSLKPELAAEAEQDLFQRWRDGVIAGGVPEEDLERVWEDYRLASLFVLAYPVIAARGMDLDEPRERDLANAMMRRLSRSAVELNLVELLD